MCSLAQFGRPVRVPGFCSSDDDREVPIRSEMVGITLASLSVIVYNGLHDTRQFNFLRMSGLWTMPFATCSQVFYRPIASRNRYLPAATFAAGVARVCKGITTAREWPCLA